MIKSNSSFLKDPGLLKFKRWIQLLSYHLDKAYIQTLLKIIYNKVKIKYTSLSQEIIGPNLPITNNTPNIPTQDLEKKIAYNKVIKLNAISDAYISLLLGLESMPHRICECLQHLLYP